MKKLWVFIILILFDLNNIFAENVFTVEIQNIIINGGTIYVAIYSDKQSFENKHPDIILQVIPDNFICILETTLSEGEYVIAIFQDSNGNGKMDYGLFGIPKEPYGFSNMEGKTPGNYNQLKFKITNSNKRIIIQLVKW